MIHSISPRGLVPAKAMSCRAEVAASAFLFLRVIIQGASNRFDQGTDIFDTPSGNRWP
jgi:hypothetical protein